MPFSNLDLAAFATNAWNKKARYWFGTFWLKATTSLYNSKKAQYPAHYTKDRAAQYKKDIAEGRMVTDCAGLIKGFFWSKNGTRTSKYADGFPDVSADQMMSGYMELTGPISTMPDAPGLLVWLPGHIGVSIGNGYVIEARGFAYGVVRTKIKDRAWVKWGRMKAKYLTYADGAEPEPLRLGDRPLRKGDEGEDVRELQKLLIGWGYSCGKWGADGEFGAATQSAVKAWQYGQGLPETGAMGAEDFARIERLLNPEEPGGGEGGEGGEPDAPERYVTVTGGNTVNIRSAPNTGAPILGIAYRGDAFEYAGRSSADGWHSIHFNADTGWISGKYTALSDAPIPAEHPLPDDWDAVIVDLDQHSDLRSKNHDWAKVSKSVDLLILRCGVTRTGTAPIGIGVDADFAHAAARCKEHGIPFGVYYYGKVKATADARKEADMAWETASPHGPLFYVYDVEEDRLTDACILAWAERIRARGAGKVGLYIGHNHYDRHREAVKAFDFVWIPRYGKNDGAYDPKYAPAYPCALHQYTSTGKVPGIADGTLDLNRLTGERPLGWFLGD